MSGLTNGPWKVGNGLNNDGSRPVSSEDGRIAFVHVRDEDAPSKNLWKFEDAERDANARLIAAAPDLLNAAQEVLAGLHDRLERARDSKEPAPVFRGIADLSDAINAAVGKKR